MKVLVTSQGNSLDSPMDPRFGRCAYLILMDTDSGQWQAVENPAAGESGGAGIALSQYVAGQKVQAIVTGNIGPNAARALGAAGIKVYVGAQGTVQDALTALKEDKLTVAAGATVRGHQG